MLISKIGSLILLDSKIVHFQKNHRFLLCNGLLTEMERYTRNMQVGEYLFKSRKGENKAITTVQAYRIINRAAKRIKLEEIGTHTMRKT